MYQYLQCMLCGIAYNNMTDDYIHNLLTAYIR